MPSTKIGHDDKVTIYRKNRYWGDRYGKIRYIDIESITNLGPSNVCKQRHRVNGMFALSASPLIESVKIEAVSSQFIATEYSSELLQNLNRLFTDQCLCDVGLVVHPDRQIRAHRCVLSAASPYFHAMLTGGLRESSSDVIDMQAVGAPYIIEKLVAFIYTGLLIRVF